MSASPSNPTPGSTSATPNAAMPTIRRKANTSIFNKKKPLKRPPQQAQTHTGAGQVPMSETQALGPHASVRPTANGQRAPPNPDDDPSLYTEYPIYINKSALARDLHHHAFKMNTDERKADGRPVEVNPYDEQVFTRPVRLHRRLARDKAEGADQSAAASDVDDKEREVREAKKAERQAEREANQAQIAPTGEAGKKPTKKKPQKKVEDVYYDESNPKHQLRSQLRYAEARPWHLEDFEGKQKWIGSYEQPLSNTNVMFEVADGGFKMVPVEKWYKMVRSDRVSTMDMGQVEKIMQAKHTAPRWFMNSHEAADAARAEAFALKREQIQNARRQPKQEDEDGPSFVKQEDYRADVDEIDFEFNDEFQDDDEGFIYGDVPDEDTKEIEKRIRKEMRDANLGGTGVKDEDKDWDEEEQNEKRAEDEERKKQKKLRRKLKRKEMRHEYESDTDDENKYEESSEDEDSEEEREREEKERKEKEAAQANDEKSGSSTKGTSTPTGRLEKKAVPGASLKRDAELSELSGNESSRKKAKFNGTKGSNGAARSLSPDAARRMPSGYGSGSETDTSRPGRTKLKLKNSPPGSPNDGSRAASPSGSRAQSPALSPPVAQPFPTLDEIKAAIPPAGIAIGELVKRFKLRLGDKGTDFITMVKNVGRQDPATKKIVRRD